MIVNGFCKEVFRALSMEYATDALRDVADGVNALKSPERATILVTHYQRVNNTYFLKAAVNAVRKHRGEPELRRHRGDRRPLRVMFSLMLRHQTHCPLPGFRGVSRR